MLHVMHAVYVHMITGLLEGKLHYININCDDNIKKLELKVNYRELSSLGVYCIWTYVCMQILFFTIIHNIMYSASKIYNIGAWC